MPDWDLIKKEYEETELTMKELAEKHDVKPATLRSRKNREKWQRNTTNNVATKKATQRKNVATRKAEKIIENNSELKGWEIEFCYEYLRTWNGTKSYMKVRDVTYNSARAEAAKTLAKPSIKRALKEIKKETDVDLLISIEDIKREYFKQAFADINDFIEYGTEEVEATDEYGDPIYKEDGTRLKLKRSFIYFKDMKEIDGRLVKEVRMGKDGPVIQLHDKQKAMQELLKLMDDSNDNGSGVVFVDNEEAMKRYMREHGESYAD